jgi:large subunit ribosomal protein L22
MSHSYMPVTMNRQSAAKAMGKDLPISPKVSIEICNFLRHKELEKAISILTRVQDKVEAIPYKRFPNGAGHKPGKSMAAGRYPIKAATEFLKLLENAKANASNQGLTGTLKITHIAAQRANEPFRNRAKERITFKRTHVEVIVTEDRSEPKEKKARPKKATKAGEPVEAQS